MNRRVLHAIIGVVMLLGLILFALGATGGPYHHMEIWRPVP